MDEDAKIAAALDNMLKARDHLQKAVQLCENLDDCNWFDAEFTDWDGWRIINNLIQRLAAKSLRQVDTSNKSTD